MFVGITTSFFGDAAACLMREKGLPMPLAGGLPQDVVDRSSGNAFVLQDIRRQLDASMIIIEHDMPLIMSISDRVYCMEAGKMIAEGDPTTVRNDPRVITSYLGTDERAIQRSGSAS